ncbi:MAG: heavy metal-associated domain-containing protein [Nanoarchaeota archaeon]
MKKLKITISGMHCAGCAANVEKSLKKVSGVKQANVSLMTNKGFVEADDKVSDEDIKKAIARAGYKTLNIEKE